MRWRDKESDNYLGRIAMDVKVFLWLRMNSVIKASII